MLGVRIPPGLQNSSEWQVFEKVTRFLKEVRAELGKVTWPTKHELVGSTIVVIVVCTIVSIFIGIVDRILTFAIKAIFGVGLGG